jgi:hypothetical protein
VLAGGAALLAGAPDTRRAAAAAEPKVQAVEVPITAVTVYSDRARVTRTARLTGTGGGRVQLPILTGRIDPASIRVEVQGSDAVAVQRIEISYVEASELPLPVGEPEKLIEKLLDELDRVDDQIAQVQSEQAAYSAQARLLGRMQPSTSGLGQPAPGSAPPPRLNPTGWPAVFQFVRQGLERVHKKSRELDEQLRTLRLKRREIVDKGQKLGGLIRRAGYRVTATLSGSGSAQLALSYVAHGARWLPTYDIQLQPAQNRVELSLAGLVSQQTGEDWTDAALTLSTAVPATATQLPKLRSWRLGERERFIPTPAPQAEGAPPPPPAPPIARIADADEALRQRLLSRLGLPSSATTGEDGNQVADEFRPTGGMPHREARKKEAKPVFEFDSDDLAGDMLRQRVPAAPAAPPPPPPAEPAPVMPEGTAQLEQPVTMAARSEESVRVSSRRGPSRSAPIEVLGVGLSPPPGYSPPSYDPSLPASLAGGYDLLYAGLYRDTVKSGQGARRVALLSRSFPVTVSRKLFPALAPEAFLVAEIKNPGNEPLPGGQAHLFVGADPAGVAQLRLIAPGEVFTLPLGLDRAIRPVRNVQVTTVEKGVFSKDEISEYVVTTEVVNPYRVAVDLRLHDQIPIIGDKNVEIRLVRTDPRAQLDEKKGALDWRLVVAPGAKLTTTFVYSLRRPKGYRLNQAQY